MLALQLATESVWVLPRRVSGNLHVLQETKASGATLLTGGKRPAHTKQGYFIEPTVFINVKPGMRLWREEVFGPVLASATFSTEEEAVAIANASEYGLAAAVISADMDRCKRVAAAMETGIVWINCSQPCFAQVGTQTPVALRAGGSAPIRGAFCSGMLSQHLSHVGGLVCAGALGWQEGERPWPGTGHLRV